MMMLRGFVFVFAVALLAPLLAPLTAQEFQTETEPNNTSGTANALNVVNNKARVRAPIFPNGDIDFFSFNANAGDRVYAAVMTSSSANATTDSQLRVISTDGTTEIEFDEDDGSMGGLSSSIAGATITNTGVNYLRVNHFSATNQLRPYELYFFIHPVGGGVTPEVEPNDATGTATPITANSVLSGVLLTNTDVDFYSLNLNAGDTVFISMDLDPERDNVTFNGQVGLGVFGTQILVVNDASVTSPNSEAFFITVASAGQYFVFTNIPAGGTGSATATYRIAVSVFSMNLAGLTQFSNATSAAIPTGPGAITSTINVATTGRIKKIGVGISLTHTNMPDLDVMLTAPNGTRVPLFTDIGSSTQTVMNAIFFEDAACPPLFTVMDNVVYKTELDCQLSTQLYGCQLQGDWTLTIEDDLANNGGTLNSWGILVELEPIPALTAPSHYQVATIFSADFESGDAGFTHTGTQDEWERGTPTFAPITTANSGTNCWATDLDNTYNASSDQSLLSPSISLAGVVGPIRVQWAMKHHIESASFDNLTVSVREVGNPTNQQILYQWLGATQNTTIGAASVAMSTGWGTRFADISAFAGLNIEFVVRLTSDTSVNLTGVAIDDVIIEGCINTNPTYTPIGTNVLRGVPSGTSNENIGTASDNQTPLTQLTVSVIAGAPSGVTFGTGVVDGTGNVLLPITVASGTTLGVYPITVRIQDGAGGFDDDDFNLEIASINAPPNMYVPGGSSFATGTDFDLTVQPGAALTNAHLEFDDSTPEDVTVAIAFTGGPMGSTPPAGITAPSSGFFAVASLPGTLSWTGTANANNTPGIYTWQVNLTDSASNVTLFVNVIIPNIAPTHVPATGQPGGANGQPGTPYEAVYTAGQGAAAVVDLCDFSDANTGQTLAIDTGNPPFQVSGPSPFTFTYTLMSGTTLNVAPGVTLAAGDAGVHIWNVAITDGLVSVTVQVEITVNPPIVFTSSTTLTSATQNTTYAGFNVTTTGGTGAITFSITSGALPTGLTMSAGGVVSGATTVAPASFPFTITATDSLGVSATQNATIDVVAPAGGIPSITNPSPLPAGTVNSAYVGITFTGAGGVPAYSFALAPGSGPIPPGMTLSTAGDLTGTPIATGTFVFTVRITDSASVFADEPYSLTINSSGGKKKGGGGDDGGCTVGASSSPWLLLALAGVLVAFVGGRKRRAER